ncbi:protein jagged-2-like [Mytilus californianus]|uniref:protein jagged-2-like n=1 Tax=Mytilus californianus TaxID=6549 RepID=UPI0022460C05|nr:protein jagged-2-like [Mytilus californianus]
MKLQVLCVVGFICGVSCINQNNFRKYLVSRRQSVLERHHKYDKDSGSKENDVFDDDEVVTITCGEGEVISVVNANYGSQAKPRKPRKNRYHGKGRKGGKPGKDLCSDPQSLVKVEGECNGKQTCEFTVSDLFDEDDCINEEEPEARSWSKYSNDIQLWLDYQCIPHPCLNFYCAHGGICVLIDMIDLTPQCNCMNEWTGANCDDNPCEADANPCPQKSTCSINSDGSVSCCCDDGYTGDRCDVLVDACTVNPCQNGGQCSLDSQGLPVCTCVSNFDGMLCDVNCDLPTTTCPTDFTEIPAGSGNCYYTCDTETGWLGAVFECRAKDAYLWKPNTQTELTGVGQVLDGADRFWTGASDQTAENSPTFELGSLSALSLTADSNGVNSDCVAYEPAGDGLIYRTCHTQRKCVCEKQIPCSSQN